MRSLAIFQEPLAGRLGRALFRVHTENGAFVSLGMAAVGLGSALLFGRNLAVLAATGALCASILDQPGPLPVKARMFALGVAGSTLLTVLTILADGHALMMGMVVAVMSFASGLVTAYGRRTIGLGVAAVLALLFGMSANLMGALPVPEHVAVFAAGGIAYSLFALGAAALLEERNLRLFLGEAVHAFGNYLTAKAALYDPKTPTRPALETLVDAHATFTERLQAARDMIFVVGRRRRWQAALLALLDCFDTVVSSAADIETLRGSGRTELLARFKALTEALAADCKGLALALMTPGMGFSFDAHAGEIAAIEQGVKRLEAEGDGEESLAVSAFRSTGHKLAFTVARLEQLARAADSGSEAAAILPDVDLEAFVQRDRMDPRVLTAQFDWASPILRYAIRLTLAMTCGYFLTLMLPGMLHGGWVLLTTALIMRASYSVTKQRRNDRIVGTAAGCLLAALLVHVLPRDWLFLPMLVTVGTAHAFANVDFRITALAASITALLQLHFIAPEPQADLILVAERLADTLIGAGLAWAISFLLPSWEWRTVPRLVKGKIAADRRYAALSLARQRNDHDFRLARKRAHDATAVLSMTVRRLSDEPKLDRDVLGLLGDLLAANFLLASDLASMRVLFRMRSWELDPQATDQLLETARNNVALAFGMLDVRAAPEPRLSRRSLGANLGGHNARRSLIRRLIHIERTAQRVAASAAKVLTEFRKN